MLNVTSHAFPPQETKALQKKKPPKTATTTFKGTFVAKNNSLKTDVFERSTDKTSQKLEKQKLQEAQNDVLQFKGEPDADDYWNYPDAYYEKYGYLPRDFVEYHKEWYGRPYYYGTYPIEVKPIPVDPRAMPLSYYPAMIPFAVPAYPLSAAQRNPFVPAMVLPPNN